MEGSRRQIQAVLSIPVALLLLFVSMLLLWKGSVWLVDSAARIARTHRISDLTIGLTIVAFGTSAPEFAVTVSAALGDQPDISVGNIVGSNAFNLGVILGGCALVTTLRTSRKVIYRDGFVLITVGGVLLAMLADGHLERWEGVILLCGLATYLTVLFRSTDPPEESTSADEASRWDYAMVIVGIVSVAGGGRLLVMSASTVAHYLGVSDWEISVTVVAAGTSAPELTTSLVAAIRGHHGMSLGNLIGSDLFNLMGVLGVAATIRDLELAPQSLLSVGMLSAMCVLVVAFMRSGWRIGRAEGCILIAAGAARWVVDFAA